MNEDIIKGQWKQIKGNIKRQWGKFTDDQIDAIDGSRERFLGSLQESYGLARDDAEKQLKEWETAQRKNDAA